MRLFLKHIFRSVRKAPLQPLIIILTLTVAVATVIATARMSLAVLDDLDNSKASVDSSFDISISLSANQDVRMLFKDDAQKALGASGSVLGEFHLTALADADTGRLPVEIVATELDIADSFYSLSLTQDTAISEKDLDSSAIISEKAAEELGLEIGDTARFNLLNFNFDFKVAAIARAEGIMFNSAAIINIGAVTEALAKANPTIAAFADYATPFTCLKINLEKEEDIDVYANLLSENEAFSDANILKASDLNTDNLDFISMLSITIVSVCAIIIFLICAIVIITSLDLLLKERMAVMGLFMLSGAHGNILNKILYLECFIYSIASAFFGLLLSIPLTMGLGYLFDFPGLDPAFSLINLPIALIASPVSILCAAIISAKKVSSLTVSERISRANERFEGKTSRKSCFVFLIAFLILLTVALCVPANIRFAFGFSSAVALIAFIFAFAPRFASAFTRLSVRMLEKKRTPPPSLLISQKNFAASFSLRHTSKLLTLLITLITTCFVLINLLSSQISVLADPIDAEYIAIGADGNSDAVAEESRGVNDCYRIFMSTDLLTEYNSFIITISLSEEAQSHFNEQFCPEKLPCGDEIIISSGLASLTDSKVGDRLTLFYHNSPYTFRVLNTVDSVANVAFVDAEMLGEKKDLLCIGADFATDSADFAALSEKMNLRGVYISSSEEAIFPLFKLPISFLSMARYILVIAFITMISGIINLLFADYLYRKREKEIYYTVGITAREIRKVGILETLSCFFIAIILSMIFSAALLLLLDFSLISFGVDLIPII